MSIRKSKVNKIENDNRKVLDMSEVITKEIEQTKKELYNECIESWRDCAKVFRKQAKEIKEKDKILFNRMNSIATTFEINAKIIESVLGNGTEKDYNSIGTSISKEW